jgi:hypothetical protein
MIRKIAGEENDFGKWQQQILHQYKKETSTKLRLI